MPFTPCSLIASLPPLNCDQNSAFAGYADFCRLYQLEFGSLAASQHLGQVGIEGQQIAVHLFRPQRPTGTLVIVHGYLDHHGLYRHLIRYGLERGLNILCFDLPGHGLSSGTRASIDSFEHYQAVFQTLLGKLPEWRLCRPLHLLGQSTGGAIINQFLLTTPAQSPEIDGRIVLLAPLVRPARWRWVRLAHALLSPWKTAVTRDFSANSQDPAFNAFLRRDPLQSPLISTAWIGAMQRWIRTFEQLPPTNAYQPLLIQGQQDNTVDWSYNLPLLRQKFPRLQHLLLPNARHQLANETAETRQQYLDWLDLQGFANRAGVRPYI
ncbi:MAG: alpha-beta hydrolase superfamily lysophospholipase [Motiliproteus sp.]|jgi:alpha-beta hydrolase superfamily lysophospholipase